MASNPIPYLEKDVLLYLDAIFPNMLPSKPISEAELARMVGQQDVIRLLKQIHETQVKQQLGGK